MQDSAPSVTQTRVLFDGRGMEFFRIWFVNVALTILTLGIYSAWAKVRTQNYFYGNTKILNQSFQYHATGGQILKGRLIAVAAFILYQVLASLAPIAALVVVAIFMLAVPWLTNAGLRFNARMSSWRNVRFDFEGSYGKAFMVTFVWPLLGVLTLGILMPMAVQRSAKYIVEGHRYGDQPFDFTALTNDYGRVIWGLMITYLVIIIATVVALTNEMLVLAGIGYLAFYLVALAIKPLLFNVYWRHVKMKGNGFVAGMSVKGFAWVFLTNSLAVAFSLGLMYPWAKVRMAKFTADSLNVVDTGNIALISAAQQRKSSAVGEEMGEVFDVDVGFGV